MFNMSFSSKTASVEEQKEEVSYKTPFFVQENEQKKTDHLIKTHTVQEMTKQAPFIKKTKQQKWNTVCWSLQLNKNNNSDIK